MNDHPLGDITPDHSHATGLADAAIAAASNILPLSVEEILDSARRVEKVAKICMRADLVAEHEELIRELSTLVDAEGKVVEDPEASVGEESAETRARRLHDRLTSVRREMAGAMRSVRFRAMDSDAWSVFYAAHYPKKDGADLRDWNNRLIAETAIEPTLTTEQVEQLRKKLSPSQITELVTKATSACTQGGLDIPKLSSSLAALTLQ